MIESRYRYTYKITRLDTSNIIIYILDGIDINLEPLVSKPAIHNT